MLSGARRCNALLGLAFVIAMIAVAPPAAIDGTCASACTRRARCLPSTPPGTSV